MQRANDNSQWQLGLVLLVAFITRIAWWIGHVTAIENEGAEYARLAMNLRDGVGYVGMLGGEQVLFPPLYPTLIALFSLFVGDPETAGRLVSLVAGLALVFAIHRITREIFGNSVALIGAILAALHPLLVGLSVTVYSESLSAALISLGLYATIRMIRQPSFGRSTVVGLLFGVAYLARPEGLVFAMIAAAFVAIAAIRQRQPAQIAVRHIVTLLLATAIMASPYVTFLSVGSGTLLFEGKTQVNAVVNDRLRAGMSYPEAARGLGPNMELDGPYLVADQFELLQHRRTDPLEFLSPIMSNPYAKVRSLVYDVATSRPLGLPFVGLLVAIGLIALRWWRTSLVEGGLCLAFLGLQISTLLLLEFRFERYLFPILPLLLPWAAAGIERLSYVASRLAQRFVSGARARHAIGIAIGVGLIVQLQLIAFPATVVELDESRDVHLRHAGNWIKENFDHPNPTIATNGTVVPYYAHGTLHYLPFAPEPLALRYLHTIRPNFVVVVSTDKRQAPYIADWLQRGIPDRCAVPATVVRGPDGEVVNVWRWSCADANTDATAS